MLKTEFDKPTVLLVRHGKTAFNKGREEDRLKGTRYDLPLEPEGKREVEKDAKMLAKYDLASLGHSGMKRAKQSAEIISKHTGVEPEAVKQMDPWDVGYLSGQRRSIADARIRYYINHAHKPIPEGEAYQEWYDRFSQALANRLKRAQQTPGKAHVLVTHSCGILAAEAAIRGENPRPHTADMPEPGRVVILEKRNGRWYIDLSPDL